jgi:hypothetical protein
MTAVRQTKLNRHGSPPVPSGENPLDAQLERHRRHGTRSTSACQTDRGNPPAKAYQLDITAVPADARPYLVDRSGKTSHHVRLKIRGALAITIVRLA